jgi:hypothetical protein
MFLDAEQLYGQPCLSIRLSVCPKQNSLIVVQSFCHRFLAFGFLALQLLLESGVFALILRLAKLRPSYNYIINFMFHWTPISYWFHSDSILISTSFHINAFLIDFIWIPNWFHIIPISIHLPLISYRLHFDCIQCSFHIGFIVCIICAQICVYHL